MPIRSVDELDHEKLKIDLSGPDGNAFCLLGKVKQLCKITGGNPKEIQERMMSGDYEQLLEVFEEEFGDLVDLYR